MIPAVFTKTVHKFSHAKVHQFNKINLQWFSNYTREQLDINCKTKRHF